MSTLAKNVSQVVLYENQVSDFVALLWMQTPLGSRTIRGCAPRNCAILWGKIRTGFFEGIIINFVGLKGNNLATDVKDVQNKAINLTLHYTRPGTRSGDSGRQKWEGIRTLARREGLCWKPGRHRKGMVLKIKWPTMGADPSQPDLEPTTSDK